MFSKKSIFLLKYRQLGTGASRSWIHIIHHPGAGWQSQVCRDGTRGDDRATAPIQNPICVIAWGCAHDALLIPTRM